MTKILHILTHNFLPHAALLGQDDILLSSEAIYLALNISTTICENRKVMLLEHDWLARSGNIRQLTPAVSVLNKSELPDLLANYDINITW